MDSNSLSRPLASVLARMAFAVVAAAAIAAATPAFAQHKVLKFVPEADLRSLDPIWTTAYITRNHGYMIYDVLLAVDENFDVKPQMVDKWEISDDKLSYTFTLRDGLMFHDGQPVRSADCIASIERWAKRDVFGQKLGELTESWTAVDDKTFRLKLKRPFPYVLDALAKPSSNVPFIMPERLAKTDAFQQVTEAIGSGPFKFVEYTPGARWVGERFDGYFREGLPYLDGFEVVQVEGTGLTTALSGGQVDANFRMVTPPQQAQIKGVRGEEIVFPATESGTVVMAMLNQKHAPFADERVRRALNIAIDRDTGLPAIIAERGERPVAVLVDYTSWAALQGGCSTEMPLAVSAERVVASRQTSGQHESRPLAGPAQPAQQDATVGMTGWGSQSAPRGPDTGEPAALPAGWRAATSGWGG